VGPLNHRELPGLAGNAVAGRELFYRREAPKCWVCHAIGAETERAGPNLATIGAKHDHEALLDALLNPSREIVERYAVEIITTRALGTVIGVVARQSPSLLVRNELGDEIDVPLDQVVSRRESDLSMMPDDLTDALTDQELVDLLAFLGSLR
jgi:putative heme-binding domain-containing protein